MKLILNQEEIHAAIRDYAIKQGLALQDKFIDISLTAGRKENGFTAELEIGDTPVELAQARIILDAAAVASCKVDLPEKELVNVDAMKKATINTADKFADASKEPEVKTEEAEVVTYEADTSGAPSIETNSLFHPALKAE